MAYEQRENTGSLFENDKKRKDDPDDERLPDRKGDALLVCPHCNKSFSLWMSGWLKITSEGKRWLSMAFSYKDSKPPAKKKEEIKFPSDDEVMF